MRCIPPQVCEGLLHHNSRFSELLQLRRLSLPCDDLDTATAAADPLLEVLRRARGLRCLRLIATSPNVAPPPPPPPPPKAGRAVPPPPRASLLAHLLGAVTLGGAPLRLLQVQTRVEVEGEGEGGNGGKGSKWIRAAVR